MPDNNTINADNSAYEAIPEHPPMLKLSIGIAELTWGLCSNCVQVVTSTIAIVAMVIGSEVGLMGVPTLLKVYPWAALIGFGIAGSIQLFLHKNAQSMSSTWTRLRQIQHFNIKSTHALKDVESAITINTLYFMVALVADIVSDATFVNLFTHNGLVILFWIVFLTGSSTLLMYDGATRVWGAIEDFKDYAAYHAKYDQSQKRK
jgi:hypothetical protein